MKELTDEILEKLGFSDYDDEHCTWGNRRWYTDEKDDWSCLQIVEWCDYPEENGRKAGFSYEGWFDTIRNEKNMAPAMDLKTVEDLRIAVQSFRPDLYGRFLERLKLIED